MIVYRDSLHKTYKCTYICTCIYNKIKGDEVTGPSGNLLDTPIRLCPGIPYMYHM